MNNSPFDFDSAVPPKIDENALRHEIERRRLKRQILLLKLSGFFTGLTLCLLTIISAVQSVALAVCFTVILFFYLLGYLLIYFFFFSKGMSPQKTNLRPCPLQS